ncbi:MAG: hypothetical protein VKL42_04350 [Snowella sp.]|nr:hypothetical protein [Snowella sp.]
MKSWIVFSVLALVLAGCGGRGGLPCIESSTSEGGDVESVAEPFDNLQVQVGVDASESMQGFVSRPGTRYSQAIASLHTLLQNKKVPTTYWRVGGNVQITAAQPISPGQFLVAAKPDFYCSRDQVSTDYPCVSSTLGQIYELKPEGKAGGTATEDGDSKDNEDGDRQVDESPRTLKILLTDLEPDNSAVGTLSGLISQELEDNPTYKAVLIGVRSQFQGNVYAADGRSFTTLKYDTTGQDIDQKGRPFFILMSGPEETVNELVKQFRRLPLDVNKAFRASTFQQGERSAATLDSQSFKEEIKKCVTKIGAIDGQRPNGDQEGDWLMIEEDSECTNGKPIELQIPSKNTVMLTGGELTSDLFEISEPSLVTVKEAQIEPNPAKDETRLKLTLGFDGEKMSSKDGELIYITLLDRNLDQAVWEDWDMDINQPDGSKTQNLRLFVSGLRQAMGQEQNAVKFCLGYSRY